MAASRRRSSNATRSEMIRGAAVAFWVPAWADYAEEHEGASFSGVELTDVAPPPPPAAVQLAARFVSEMERQSRRTAEQIREDASRADNREADPRELGYYLAMTGLGHGVSWADNHEIFSVSIPRAEAYVPGRRTRGGYDFEGYISTSGRPLR